MSTFLMMLLSVVGLIVAFLLLLLFWARRKVRRIVGNYQALAPFLIRRTARLKLRIEPLPVPDDSDQETAAHLAAMQTLWAGLAARGVNKLSTFASDDGRLFIAGQHPGDNLIALVQYQCGMPPFLEFITLSGANSAKMLTGEAGARALGLPSLQVDAMADPDLDAALAAFAGAPAGRVLDARMLMLLIERLHATRMDSQLGRAPTEADMMGRAAACGAGTLLTEAQRVRALELNRRAWIEAVHIALLDHARRQLKLDEEAWGRLEQHLIVVHQGMHADEVIGSLSDIALVGQLGEQLKRQHFGPSQIFDEINRRLDDGERRQLVVQLGVPLQARLFALPNALQAAGVDLKAAA